MPLLSRRRSALDLFKSASKESTEEPQPTTPISLLVPQSNDGRPKSDYGYSRSRLSHEVLRDDLPDPDNAHDALGGRAKRFSMLKLRNFSESQLSYRAKEAGKEEKLEEREDTPPVPAMPSSSALPAIVKTAPTMDVPEPEPGPQEGGEKERKVRPSLFRRSMSKGRSPSKREPPRKSTDEKRIDKKSSSMRWRRMQGRSTGLEDLQRMAAAQVASNHAAPPSYGDESNSALALPLSGPRFSESSRSDGSNGSDQIYGSTTTTTHTVSTHTTFFKLPGRNKNRNSLFPLPVKLPPPQPESPQEDPPTPRASTSALPSESQSLSEPPNGRSVASLPRRHTESSPTKQTHLPPNASLAKGALSFAEPGMNLFRGDSQRSRASSNSSPLQPPPPFGLRDRASTASTNGRSSHDMGTPPPLSASGRNSTSTTGRSSLGGLLSLSRFRQSSDPHSPRHGSPGTMSKSNSFAMSREALVVPEREEGDTPVKYLERLEAAVARSMIAGILSKSTDPFAQAVLRSYTRRFPFFGEPIDMSLRKFLLEADLPKETQQVDRVVQAFADRYHECNPGIFVSPDQAYIIAFSLMMLHTDAFNKNNKRKMQKHDYIKNTSGQQVSDDVLGCFYDNICYTPFVHYEEEVDINGERVLPFKPKKNKVKAVVSDSNKKPTGPVDPYNLLVDQKLDMLRPAIKDTIALDDPYNYKGNKSELDPHYLQRAFTHTGVLQIISQRSRPTAYEGQLTNGYEPQTLMEMQPGIIDIKITKVGTLWRKAARKKKARSPWQEWGAVLTGSQLYLFKNAHWAKGLVHQFNSAQERGKPRTPVTFKPPLQEFKPDALIKTDNAVALVDQAYIRHKHAFTFIGPSGYEEVMLADTDGELHDWLALINYAAAFRSAGVRIRGMVGGAEEDARAKDVRRLESTQSTRSVQSTQSAGSALMQNRGLTPQLERQVMAARRQIMVQKVGEATREISEADQQLDTMLRNARHLLVLAPIAPKTREDTIHAAARADANIKWTRRDIWRMKCYKDILAMDVQQDGLSASEIETLAEQKAAELPAESAKKSRLRGLSRLNSRASATRSPPQSPASPTYLKRPSTATSLEMYTNDVFRTPPESATILRQMGGDWRLPPLQLDVQADQQHRGSVSSALLSTSSQSRNSVSQGSTMSSAREAERVASYEPSESAVSRGRPTSGGPEDREVEFLARATLSPERMEQARTVPNVDGATPTATPESASKQQRSSVVRRSLQKTLRDTHQHPSTTSHHKHKKGKESDSTVRSIGATSSNDGEQNAATEEGTPGLKREKGRFILHGKQASVVHFGSDWPNERMKARREAWRQGSSEPTSPLLQDDQRTPRATPFSYGFGRADVFAPVLHDFRPGESGEGESEDEVEPPGSAGFARDAQAAEAFTMAESPEGREEEREVQAYFDALPLSSSLVKKGDASKRETVIGPNSHQRKLGLQEGEEGEIVSADDDDDDDDEGESVDDDDDDGVVTPRNQEKRTTVIGPMSSLSSARSPQATEAASAGAEEDEDESGEEDGEDDEFVEVNEDRSPATVNGDGSRVVVE